MPTRYIWNKNTFNVLLLQFCDEWYIGILHTFFSQDLEYSRQKINLYFKVYHECDHDGQSVGYLLGSLYQDDSQTDGHPHHTSQKGRRANYGIGGRW